MMDSVRRAIVVLSLLLLGGGYAACACASVAGGMAGLGTVEHAPESGTHHVVVDDEPQGRHCSPDSGGQSHDCTYCLSAALPADPATKAINGVSPDLAALPAMPKQAIRTSIRLTDLNIEPARGPPLAGRSLVTLKVRLQN